MIIIIMIIIPIIVNYRMIIIIIIMIILIIVNFRDDHQFSPLHWAAKGGHTKIVEMLVNCSSITIIIITMICH